MKRQIESSFTLPLTTTVKNLAGTTVRQVASLEVGAIFYEDDSQSVSTPELRWGFDIDGVYISDEFGLGMSTGTNIWPVIEWEAGVLYEMIHDAAQNHIKHVFDSITLGE